MKPAAFFAIGDRYAILAAAAIGALLATTEARARQDEPPEKPPSLAAPDEESGASAEAADNDAFTPVRVSFRLVNGIRVTGVLTAWDGDGIDGSFARRAWDEIQYEDVWRIYLRICDQESALDWIDLGRIMLLVTLDEPRAEKWAKRAFQRARRHGQDDAEATERAIASARLEAEVERQLRDEQAAAVEAERLRTDSPESRRWSSQPWPELTDAEQQKAAATIRQDADRMLQQAGLTLDPIETDYFLFYSDLPRREMARWARELDLMYARLADQFHLERGRNLFWGKAVIFVFSQRDRFRLIEADAFGQLAAAWMDGTCHPIGPRVFVNFYRQPVDEAFAAILVHETVHGFMHRYRTPRRLPTWANEGFADHFAATLFRNSPMDQVRRRRGLRFVRQGGNVDRILDMDYDDGSWPGENEIGYSVGYLLVALMIRDRPRKFGAWVDAVKDGKAWEQALEDDFGVSRARLVETFVQYYRTND